MISKKIWIAFKVKCLNTFPKRKLSFPQQVHSMIRINKANSKEIDLRVFKKIPTFTEFMSKLINEDFLEIVNHLPNFQFWNRTLLINIRLKRISVPKFQ